MQDTLAKKIFAVGSAVAMTVSLAIPFAAQAAAHGVGTNVLTSDGTVWMVTSVGRRAYTSAGAFLSYGFNSWSGVVAASPEDLNLPTDPAGFIPPQDGTVFCASTTKGSDVKGECSLVTVAQKAAFTSAPVFSGLGFSFARAQYGDSSFLSKTSNIDNTTSAHRPGVLVNNSGTVLLVGTTGLLGIPDLATFNSWGYSFANVVPANAADKAMVQTGVMAMRQAGQLSPTALANVPPCTGSNCPTPVQTGSLTASLASDNPAASTLVSTTAVTNGNVQPPGQTGADLAHFMFTGTGTVTQVVINRIGVSSDNSINNVYLYMGNNRITDAGSFSTGKVTFTNSAGLFTVNGTATISVKVDVAGGISGQTVGAQLASFAIASGAAQPTSVSGNLFTIAQVNNLATVTVPNPSNTLVNGQTQTSTITSSAASNGIPGTINAGTANAILWSGPVTVSQRNVLFKYIQFKQIGSIAQDAITNLKLTVDGTAVGSPASISNSGGNSNVVIFDMTGSPVTLQSGSHTIELHGDIVKGSSFNYNFSVQTAADAVFFDTNYGVNVPFTLANGQQISQLSPGTSTINAGLISVQQDVAFTATQFVANQSQTVLGQWTLKAFGENVKVQNISVLLNYTMKSPTVPAGQTGPATNEGFNNLSLFVNGGAVGSTVAATGATNPVTFSFGTSNLFTVPAGTTVTLAVKGDSVLNTPTNVAAVRADLITPANSMQGVTSFQLSPQNGTITYQGRQLTTGSSNGVTALNSQFNNTNLTTNMVNQKIGSFVIQSGSIDGVRVSNLTVGMVGTYPLTSLSNLYIATPAGNATPVSPNSSNNFSVNFTVPANQTATVDVFADVGNTNGTSTSTAAVAATDTIVFTGTSTAASTATTTINGFTITVPVGSGASSTTIASNLATAINAATGFSSLVSASAFGGTVTLTAVATGTGGNSITVGPPTSTLNGVTTTVTSPTLLGGVAGTVTGTVQTTLVGTGSGATSNQSVTLNTGPTPPSGVPANSAVPGQILTVGTGSLSTISLTGSSPSSSFVLGGGVNQPAATYTFHVSPQGGVTITELGFKAIGSAVASATVSNNTITSVTVGGSTGQVVNGNALVTGLNIAVPIGNAGLDIPVTVTYAGVGSPSTVVDQLSQLTLAHVKFLAGNNTVVNGTAAFEAPSSASVGVIGTNGIPANSMSLVGTVPTVTLTGNTNTLVSGTDIIGSVTIAAAGGRLDMIQLPLIISAGGGTTVTGGTVTLLDRNNSNQPVGLSTTTPGSAVGLILGATETNNLLFGNTDGRNQITGGSSRTYDVQVSNVACNTSTTNTNCTLVLQLGGAGLFLFNDVNGGNTTPIQGAVSGTTYIVNYPTTSVSIKSN